MRRGLRLPFDVPHEAATLLCLLALACQPGTEQPETRLNARVWDESSAVVSRQLNGIEGGVDVSAGLISRLGAVRLFAGGGCSGTLVTPYWVLTAAHCEALVGDGIYYGNVGETSIRISSVAEVVPHPQSGTDCEWDAALLRLAHPIFPTKSDGRLFERYRRDLFRGSIESLVSEDVDIYGYGYEEDGNTETLGFLRFGAFTLDEADDEDDYFEFDSDTLEVWGGDSGSGVLTPGNGVVGYDPDQEIAGVAVCRAYVPFDYFFKATSGPQIADWFDEVIGPAWTVFDAPSQVMTILLPTMI